MAHLINGLNGVWCGICVKYLAFGTYPTSAVGALRHIFYLVFYLNKDYVYVVSKKRLCLRQNIMFYK